MYHELLKNVISTNYDNHGFYLFDPYCLYDTISKYIYVFQSHVWGMKREPIKTPLLTKALDSDFTESLAIFKLILRFMNDESLSGKKEQALADYIAHRVSEDIRLFSKDFEFDFLL